MEDPRIAFMHYPTTVICVDDNRSVLQNVQLKLGKTCLCKAFLIPEEALDYIKKNLKENNLLNKIISVNAESANYNYDSVKFPIQYNVSNVYENIYDKERFSDISVVIVDYAMPSMNGEEFCRRLRQLAGKNIKIIMLTGEADDPKAIQLFNAGIIDRFLHKAKDGVDEDLKKSVIEMQDLFFKDTAVPIIQGLASENNSALGDPVFIKLFNQISSDILATNYYLIDVSGSFVFFNNEGKPTWLIIKALSDLEEIAAQVESHISQELVDTIRKGEVIPYFTPGEEIEYYGNEKKLKKSLHEAKKIKGKKEYRYAVLSELPEFSLDVNRIISFNKYMSNL